MRVAAFCAASFRQSVKRAAGVKKPWLSPPGIMDNFRPSMLSGHDFIYFKLHGLPDEVYWYGDNWVTAMSAEQISHARLDGAVVFVANCFFAGGPMMQALRMAGAGPIIGGGGTNYAAETALMGADMLGFWVRFLYQRLRMPVGKAFRLGMWRLSKGARTVAALDTLEFKLYA